MTNSMITSKLSTRFFVGSALALALLIVSAPGISHADTISRQLELGMSGTDVTALQTFLAKDATLYPEGLITGYFGSLTSSAVSKFQVRNGLPAAGRVGPMTIPVLNAQMAGGVTTNAGTAPIIGSVSATTSGNSATVGWNTNVYAKGVVYYSASPLTTYERTNSVDVSGNTAMTDANFRTTQGVTISGLNPNTVYYYLIYSTDQAGNVSVTWPATFTTTN